MSKIIAATPPGSGSMNIGNMMNMLNSYKALAAQKYHAFAEQSKDVRDRSNMTYAYFNSKIKGRDTGSSHWFLSILSVLVIIAYIVMYSLYVESLRRGQTNKKLKNGFQITAYIMLGVLMMNLIESSGAFTWMIVLFIITNILVVLTTMWFARKSITKTATTAEVTKTRFITFGLLGVACFPALLYFTSKLIQGTSYFTRVFDPFQNALTFSSVMILTVFSVMGMYFYYWKDSKISETKRKQFYNKMVYVGLGTVIALILMIAVVGFYYAYGKELMVKCIDFEREDNKVYKNMKLFEKSPKDILKTLVQNKKASTPQEKKNIQKDLDKHLPFLKEKDAYFSFFKPKYAKTIENMAKEGLSVENMEGKVREDRHLVDSRLIMIKIIGSAALIFLACWIHYTGWINASKQNKLKFAGLIAFAILTGMLTAVSIILLRSKLDNWAKNLQYNSSLILCFGVLSGVFYIIMELSGLNTYLRDIKSTKTTTTSTTTTTTTTPEPTVSTTTFGDAQCKEVQSKVMYRMVVIFGIMTCVVAVYALFALLSYSTGLSYVDGFFHRREKLGIFPNSSTTVMSTFTELFQNSHIKLGIEAFLFALFMNLVYFLVLLAYNPKSDWMSTEFKEKVMELGLVFVKFFLFYYVLVSLRTFHIKQQNPEVTSVPPPAVVPSTMQVVGPSAPPQPVVAKAPPQPPQQVVVAKALQVESIQNKSPESHVSSAQQSTVSSTMQVNNGQSPKAAPAGGPLQQPVGGPSAIQGLNKGNQQSPAMQVQNLPSSQAVVLSAPPQSPAVVPSTVHVNNGLPVPAVGQIPKAAQAGVSSAPLPPPAGESSALPQSQGQTPVVPSASPVKNGQSPPLTTS